MAKVKVKLLQGKKTPKSKWVWFWGYKKKNNTLMQVGGTFRKKNRALAFGKKEFANK